jgi:hypothetical protein
VRFTEFHRELVFNAAFFLLGSSIIQIGMKFINDLKIEETIEKELQRGIEVIAGEGGSGDGNKPVSI